MSRLEINEAVLRGGGDENRSATQAAAGMFPSGSGRMHNSDGGFDPVTWQWCRTVHGGRPGFKAY